MSTMGIDRGGAGGGAAGRRPAGRGIRLTSRRLIAAAAFTGAVALTANVAIYALGRSTFGVPADDTLTPLAIAVATALAVAAAGAGLWVLARRAPRPVRAFRLVAVAAGALSLFGPLATAAGWAPGAAGGATLAAMALMHAATIAAVALMLPALAVRRA